MRVRSWQGLLGGAVWLLLVTAESASASNRLIDAVRENNKGAVVALLAKKENVNASQSDGATALHWAVYRDNLELADLLLRAGADANASNQLGVTPLYLACENGSPLMVGRLLAARASVNAVLPSGETLLMTAARAGSASVTKALLAAGADVQARERMEGQTALMWAVSQRHPDVVQTLIEAGADIRARSRVRAVVVDMGRDEGESNENASGTLVDEGGFTPLLFAARVGDVQSARLLLEAGADVNETKPDGATALVVAAHSGQAAIGKLLLEHGADPNASGAGYTALHAAILRDLEDLVGALLVHHADVNARLTKGTVIRRQSKVLSLEPQLIGATPFFLAAKYSEPAYMSALFEAGADPLAGLSDGTTPLMVAAGLRTTSLGRLGRERRGRELDVADYELSLRENKDQRTWVDSGIEAVKLAVQLGNDVNAANKAGDTALHASAFHGFDSNIRFLVAKGARLDAKNKKGQTPLMVALSRAGADDDSVATTSAELIRALAEEQERAGAK